MFRTPASAPPPKKAKNQASVPHGSHSDVKVRKYLISSLEWTLSETLASKSTKILETSPKSADFTESTKRAASISSMNILMAEKPLSSRELHEWSHWTALEDVTSAEVTYAKLNNRMFQRCKRGYLFDCEKNRSILTDDPWLQDIWVWIEGM